MKRLEPNETFLDDGHLRDEALVALADGQLEIVSVEATTHLSVCQECEARVADHALWSLDAQAAFAAVEPRPARFPVAAVSLAVLLAGLGLLPMLREILVFPALVLRSLPVLVKSLGLVARLGDAQLATPVVWVGATALLMICALVLTRVAPRRTAWRGTVR